MYPLVSLPSPRSSHLPYFHPAPSSLALPAPMFEPITHGWFQKKPKTFQWPNLGECFWNRKVPGPPVPSEWVKRKDYMPIREWFGLQNAARWFREGVKYQQLDHKIHPLSVATDLSNPVSRPCLFVCSRGALRIQLSKQHLICMGASDCGPYVLCPCLFCGSLLSHFGQNT